MKNNSKLEIVASSPDFLPVRAHADDAGLDLKSTISVVLAPGERKLVPTGIKVALPENSVGLVCPRSGLAAKHGISVVNAPGIVDAGYRGEIKVALLNTDTKEAFRVEVGDRIAQLVITPILLPEIIEVTQLQESHRQEAGFGSSGVSNN